MKGYTWKIAGYTEKGKGKENNEDSYLFRSVENGGKGAAVLAVADGVSSLGNGEVASGKVMGNLLNWWNTSALDGSLTYKEKLGKLESLLEETNRELISWGEDNGVRTGTTASILFVWNDNYEIFHVGDSRIYRLGGRKWDRLLQLTRDQVCRIGRNRGECAYYKNAMTDCLGYRESFRIFRTSGKIKKKDVFLVCSDGACRKLHKEEMQNAIQVYRGHIDEMVGKIGGRARACGETDNITMTAIQISG